MTLAKRNWVPGTSETLVQDIASKAASKNSADLLARVQALAERNRVIHEEECFNLNPATNVMNPKAEALLSSGIGSRPSLGYPGDKYEMGLGSGPINRLEIGLVV